MCCLCTGNASAAEGWTWHPTNESAFIYWTNTYELSEAWAERYLVVTGTNPSYRVTTNDSFPYLEFFTSAVNDAWISTNFCDPRLLSNNNYNAYFATNSNDYPPVWESSTQWVEWCTGDDGWAQTQGMASGWSSFPYWEQLAQMYTGVCGLVMTWDHGTSTQSIQFAQTVNYYDDELDTIDIYTYTDLTTYKASNECNSSTALTTNIYYGYAFGEFPTADTNDWDTGDMPSTGCGSMWGASSPESTNNSPTIVTGSIFGVCEIQWDYLQAWDHQSFANICTNDSLTNAAWNIQMGDLTGSWEPWEIGSWSLDTVVDGTLETEEAAFYDLCYSGVAASVQQYEKRWATGSGTGYTNDYYIKTGYTGATDIALGTPSANEFVGDYTMTTQTVAYTPTGEGCASIVESSNKWHVIDVISKTVADTNVEWTVQTDWIAECGMETAFYDDFGATNYHSDSTNYFEAGYDLYKTHGRTNYLTSGLEVYVGGGKDWLSDGKLIVYDWTFSYKDAAVY